MTRIAPTEQAPWRRSQIAETFASVRVSATCYRLPKNVWFVAIVEAELKLRKVQRQIFLADIVVRADDSALQQRPCTLTYRPPGGRPPCVCDTSRESTTLTRARGAASPATKRARRESKSRGTQHPNWGEVIRSRDSSPSASLRASAQSQQLSLRMTRALLAFFVSS